MRASCVSVLAIVVHHCLAVHDETVTIKKRQILQPDAEFTSIKGKADPGTTVTRRVNHHGARVPHASVVAKSYRRIIREEKAPQRQHTTPDEVNQSFGALAEFTSPRNHELVRSSIHNFGQDWTKGGYAAVGGYAAFVLVACILSAAFQAKAARQERRAARLSIRGFEATDGCRQTGYRFSVFGVILIFFWVLIPIIGQGLMVCCSLAFYKLSDPLHLDASGTYSFESKAEPFITISLMCACILFYTASKGDALVASFMQPCGLDEADFVMVHGGEHHHVAPVRRESPPSFDFMCFRYVYVEAERRFRPVGELVMNGDVVEQTIGSKGLSAQSAQEKRLMVGFNEVPIQVPGIFMSLFSEFHTRMYIYQTTCIWWNFAFGYWNVALFWFSLVIICGTVKSLLITRRNLVKLRDMTVVHETVRVFRDGTLVSLPARELVPGDLILIESRSTMTCDCVLVKGGAVMLEAMLTGEPLPITKEAWVPELPEVKTTSLLFAGTEVLDASGYREGGVAEGALGVVKAIGGTTMKANLIRLVLFPTGVHFEYEDDLIVVYKVMIVYTLFLFCILKWYPYSFNSSDNQTVVIIRALFCLSQAINPMLGVAVAAGQSLSADALGKKGISCLAPHRVPIAGCIDVLVLDKTGTITKDGMELNGVQPCTAGSMGEVRAVGNLDALDQLVQHALLSCHKLSMVNGSVVGNQVEMQMFMAFPNWTLEVSGESRVVTNGGDRLEVLRVLEFDHSRMTSGCICKLPDGSTQVFIKGAAAKVSKICKEAPSDFVDVSDKLSAQCFYVLGLASKPLGSLNVSDSSRDELESGLQARGLLLFKNDLKPDSAAAIAELTEGQTRCVVCTGDHLLTGVSVAKAVGIILPQQRVHRIEVNDDKLSFIELETKVNMEMTDVVDELTSGSACLVIEQAEWDKFLLLGSGLNIVPHIRVFSRMRPDGKVAVIDRLQRLGFYVGMCGDGGNDCGALRAAHAGLALSTADASIVAPFSSGEDTSLFRFCELLKEGRACLATNIACFCWYKAYGLCITTMKVSLLLFSGANAADYQWIYLDIFLVVIIPWTMTCSKASQMLSPFRPSCRLLNSRVYIMVFGQFCWYVVTWAGALAFLTKDKSYEPWDAKAMGISPSDFAKFGDNFEGECAFLVTAMHLKCCGLVLSYGSHHRKPLWRNFLLCIAYIFGVVLCLALLFTREQGINCLMRVSCDGQTSITKDVPILSSFSSSGAGGCFLGPQMIHWDDGLSKADQDAGQKLLDIVKLATTADSTGRYTCAPPASANAPTDFAEPKSVHNILSVDFRSLLLGLLFLHAVFMHLWHRFASLNTTLDHSEQRAIPRCTVSGISASIEDEDGGPD